MSDLLVLVFWEDERAVVPVLTIIRMRLWCAGGCAVSGLRDRGNSIGEDGRAMAAALPVTPPSFGSSTSTTRAAETSTRRNTR